MDVEDSNSRFKTLAPLSRLLISTPTHETVQHYVTLPPNIRNLRDKSLPNPHGEQNRRILKR
ncbi:hypothetical protein P5673_009523 [Acropora cervicornis]|uniref:Uncharacterized protein n=1 Tax=Acropora cervicornis TaxID=6130 RepID=A0AAD9VAE5_ACRCE|nr:hypothetical protein P5673_009523 [Acropora cervicornis]